MFYTYVPVLCSTCVLQFDQHTLFMRNERRLIHTNSTIDDRGVCIPSLYRANAIERYVIYVIKKNKIFFRNSRWYIFKISIFCSFISPSLFKCLLLSFRARKRIQARTLTEKRVQSFFEALVPLHPLHVAFVRLQWRLPLGRVISLVLPGVSSLLSFVPLLDVVVRGVPVAVKRLRRVWRFQQLWVPVGHT